MIYVWVSLEVLLVQMAVLLLVLMALRRTMRRQLGPLLSSKKKAEPLSREVDTPSREQVPGGGLS